MGSKNNYTTVTCTLDFVPLLFCRGPLLSGVRLLSCSPPLPLGLGGPVEGRLGGRLISAGVTPAREGSGVVSLEVGGA